METSSPAWRHPSPSCRSNIRSETSRCARMGRVGEDEFISRVSVFDTQCAAVYLNEKTDVAFLPFGLDLFDKLVKACKAVRSRLECEQRALNTNALAPVAQIPQGTAAAKLVGNITSLTKPETVQAVTRLSTEEEARLAFLEKSLLDLQANDPKKLIPAQYPRRSRSGLGRHLKDMEAALSVRRSLPCSMLERKAAAKARKRSVCARRRSRQACFPAPAAEQWKRCGSRHGVFPEQAYPAKAFPVTEDGSNCVLCQQDLDHAAATGSDSSRNSSPRPRKGNCARSGRTSP